MKTLLLITLTLTLLLSKEGMGQMIEFCLLLIAGGILGAVALYVVMEIRFALLMKRDREESLKRMEIMRQDFLESTNTKAK